MNELKNIKLILIILITLSSIFPGCVQAPVSTPTPTPTPAPTGTVAPTAVQTVSVPTPTPTVRIPSVYKAFVDDYYGFRRVIESNNKPFNYENLTLNIKVGDTVEWVNDASSDEKLTILSEQNLWSNTSAVLRWNYQSFNYTFTRPGEYGVYIREYPRRRQNIVVAP